MKRPRPEESIGVTYGRLTVLSVDKNPSLPKIKVLCRCVCGTEKTFVLANVKNGHSVSCGCFRVETTVERSLKHGQKRRSGQSKDYSVWLAMYSRCTNPKNKDYRKYGARGIKVYDRWRTFSNFLSDMGPRPTPSHTIDRFPDVNGNYDPSNTRWATKKEQAWNRRNTVWIEHNGERKPVTEWARTFGVNPSTAHQRLKKGWSVEKVFDLC